MSTEPDHPIVVLVHGALTDASVWHPVIAELQRRDRQVLAPAMPMRSLADDASYLHSVLITLDGPIVLAAHSYGGSIISHPDAITPAVRALVFIAAFQQDSAEPAGELNYRLPGSCLTPENTLIRSNPGGSDLYLRPERFAEVYAADVDPATVQIMAAAQHPIDPAALSETFTGPPSWSAVPSWALIATADRSIPTPLLRFMAERARSTTLDVDSSHAAPVAHPLHTADLIDTAARATSPGPQTHSTPAVTTPAAT